MPFSRGKTGFLSIGSKEMKGKKQKTKQNKTKTNKDGLGPSEVALRATSPDPKPSKKKQTKKTNKKNKTQKKKIRRV